MKPGCWLQMTCSLKDGRVVVSRLYTILGKVRFFSRCTVPDCVSIKVLLTSGSTKIMDRVKQEHQWFIPSEMSKRFVTKLRWRSFPCMLLWSNMWHVDRPHWFMLHMVCEEIRLIISVSWLSERTLLLSDHTFCNRKIGLAKMFKISYSNNVFHSTFPRTGLKTIWWMSTDLLSYCSKYLMSL